MGSIPSILLTGGIGSGKSAVARLLAERGGAVYDSDSMAKSLYDRVPELAVRLEEALGLSLRDGEGAFSRARLASVIFGPGSQEAREKVEKIVHPAVFEDYRKWKKALPTASFTVFESAIVLKTGYPREIADVVVFVDAPLETRIARVIARDGVTREEAIARIDAQKGVSPDDERIDFEIFNGAGIDSLRCQLDKLMNIIK